LPPSLADLSELSELRLSCNPWMKPIAEAAADGGASAVLAYIGSREYRAVYERHHKLARRNSQANNS
jgi:hypothetical protein